MKELSDSYSPLRVHSAYGTIDTGDLDDNLETLRTKYEVIMKQPYKSCGLKEHIKHFMQKIILSCIKFSVNPIVTAQNENNRLLIACLEDIVLINDRLEERVQVLEEENAVLKKQLRDINNPSVVA